MSEEVTTTTTKTLHLQRTSEANIVPADWGRAEIDRVLSTLSKDQRADAVIVGWRGLSVQYPHRMSDVEYAQARRDALAQIVKDALADGVVTVDEMAALLAATSQ